MSVAVLVYLRVAPALLRCIVVVAPALPAPRAPGRSSRGVAARKRTQCQILSLGTKSVGGLVVFTLWAQKVWECLSFSYFGPRRIARRPRGSPRQPKGIPRAPTDAPKRAKVNPKVPEEPQGSPPKGPQVKKHAKQSFQNKKIYSKTPDQPPYGGQLVIPASNPNSFVCSTLRISTAVRMEQNGASYSKSI